MIYRIENSAILKTRKYPSVITGNTWRLLINKPWPKDSFFIERISLLMKRTNCQFFTLARFLSAEILLEIYSKPFSYKQPLETTAVQTFALHCSHSSSLLRWIKFHFQCVRGFKFTGEIKVDKLIAFFVCNFRVETFFHFFLLFW